MTTRLEGIDCALASTRSTELTTLRDEAIVTSTAIRQPLIAEFAIGPMGPQSFDPTADRQKIYRYIVNKEQTRMPVLMSTTGIQENLNDPFAKLILRSGKFPVTANETLAALEATSLQQEGLKQKHIFVIAEGGQIPWDNTTSKMSRSFRLAIAIETKGGVGPDILITTGTQNDSERNFLQIMGWDPHKKAFNFYQRLLGFWIWSGNSFHALEPETRNKGPFSGHVNGGPIMKELNAPWQHWHSMNAVIRDTALSPQDPFRDSPHFLNKENADLFENIIRSGIHLWNDARIGLIPLNNAFNPVGYLRQILENTNVNLISSSTSSKSADPFSEIMLPFSFFANLKALSEAGVNPVITPVKVKGGIYLQSLSDFAFALESNGEKVQGDTHFAFFVPEFATEDIDLLGKMIQKEIISKRLAACLLMVDFANPIYSKKRGALQAYIPRELTLGNNGADLDQKFVANISQSQNISDPVTPEGEFMTYWKLGPDNWVTKFIKMIDDYFKKIQIQCSTQTGYNAIVQLAESRRHIFKRSPQSEFPLTFAATNISSTNFPLEMTPAGTVRSAV